MLRKGAFALQRAIAPSRPDFWDPAGFTADGDVAIMVTLRDHGINAIKLNQVMFSHVLSSI